MSAGATAHAPLDTVSLTTAEVHALLGCRPGPAAETTRQVLALPWSAADDPATGWSGLVARGFTDAVGRPTGFASAVGCALTSPGRWTALRVEQRAGRRALFVLEGELGTLLVVPRPPGVLDLTPLPGEPDGPRSVPPTVRNLLADPTTDLVEVLVADHDRPCLVVRLARETPDTWSLARATDVADHTTGDVDRVLTTLTTLVEDACRT